MKTSTSDVKPLLYDVVTVVRLTGLSRSSIYKMIKTNAIESQVVCGRRLFKASHIDTRFK